MKNITQANEYGGSISVKNANLWYGDFQALKDISVEIPERQVTAFIGPSGCGKSTFLKCFNRMNDLVDGCKIEGEFYVGGTNIYGKIDVNELRKNVGMVFQHLYLSRLENLRTKGWRFLRKYYHHIRLLLLSFSLFISL